MGATTASSTAAAACPALALLLGTAAAAHAAGPAQPSGACVYDPANATTLCATQFEQIAPPADSSAAAWSSWVAALAPWKAEARSNSSWPSPFYADDHLAWARTSFLQPQTMLHDRLLFDNSKEKGGGEGWTVRPARPQSNLIASDRQLADCCSLLLSLPPARAAQPAFDSPRLSTPGRPLPRRSRGAVRGRRQRATLA